MGIQAAIFGNWTEQPPSLSMCIGAWDCFRTLPLPRNANLCLVSYLMANYLSEAYMILRRCDWLVSAFSGLMVRCETWRRHLQRFVISQAKRLPFVQSIILKMRFVDRALIKGLDDSGSSGLIVRIKSWVRLERYCHTATYDCDRECQFASHLDMIARYLVKCQPNCTRYFVKKYECLSVGNDNVTHSDVTLKIN
ncbi:unnamed protein product [Spodoptera littoralis]|uniref:Uncharacterized protein n=1 Tax=Spodoptera littoralis TaxID=7109 RepID=A0A9P0IFZ5_SPOLI|nr:unnamed protein product [Spodoptera littoralis]CAH1645495.1 unnamed protein product [Spodoptera littoralis]